MKKKILFSLLTIIICCSCNKQEAYIKNKAIKIQVQNFIEKAKDIGLALPSSTKDTVVLKFNKQKEFFKLVFEYKKPSTYDNIYTVINTKDQIIFIFSDSDISEYVYSPNPYKIDTNYFKLEKSPPIEIDWYSDFVYFNGKKISNDTLNW